jgi:hypothetical protein
MFAINTQAQEKKTVLVVPFPSHQFFSYFDANLLSEINHTETPEVLYKNLGDTLVHSLSGYKEHFHFLRIPDIEYNSMQFYINPEFKDEPISHYGIDFSKFKDLATFKNLCLNYEVDYILFFTNYTIKKKILSAKRSFEGSQFIAWSRHDLNYEMYDTKGNLIAMSDGFSIIPDEPTKSNYSEKGLNISNLKNGFRAISEDLKIKVYQYKIKGKPQFKAKSKLAD